MSADSEPGLEARAGVDRNRGRISVRTRILLVFAPLIVVLVVLLALATREATAIHTNMARVAEEDREVGISKALLVELRGAEAWALRPLANEHRADVQADLLGHIARARTLLNDLQGEDVTKDPSAPSHAEREARLRAPLTSQLDEARQRVSTDEDWSELARLLAMTRREVEVLATETTNEATHAAVELDDGVHRLVDMMFLIAVMGVVTLVVLSWVFRRLILIPLHTLQQAALAVGQGRAAPPLQQLSRDEFGVLGATFDDMARRIASHREDLEQRVAERTRELFRTARLADLGTLAAGIAHEINNPLASVAAGVEGLHREAAAAGKCDPERLEYLELVVAEAHRAKEIASRLLRLGRREERRVQPVWLNREIDEVIAMLGFQAGRRNVDLRTHYPAVPLTIESDPTEWRQVFYNLVRNALDVSPPGSTIDIAAEQRNGTLHIEVRDQGPGFAPDALERVFEPFFTTKGPGEGTGLGLAIVDRIVREHGGTVRAGNRDGGGVISIDLPMPADEP